eukprot:245787-Hanusia_phi.AAC.1
MTAGARHTAAGQPFTPGRKLVTESVTLNYDVRSPGPIPILPYRRATKSCAAATASSTPA